MTPNVAERLSKNDKRGKSKPWFLGASRNRKKSLKNNKARAITPAHSKTVPSLD